MNRLPIPITLDTFKKPGKHQQQRDASGEASNQAEENDQVAGVEMNEADHGVASASSNSNDNQPRGQQLIEEEEEELTLEDHAMIVTAILKPVAITMFFVVFCVYALHVADQPTTTYVSIKENIFQRFGLMNLNLVWLGWFTRNMHLILQSKN